MGSGVRRALKRHPEVDALRGAGFSVHAEAEDRSDEVLVSIGLPEGAWSYVVVRRGYVVASAKGDTKRAAKRQVAAISAIRPGARQWRLPGAALHGRVARRGRGARRLKDLEAELAEHMRINQGLVAALASLHAKLLAGEAPQASAPPRGNAAALGSCRRATSGAQNPSANFASSDIISGQGRDRSFRCVHGFPE
jgi:hypothetical protein